MSDPIIRENLIILSHEPFGSWLVKDENGKTIGQFENLEDAELFVSAKLDK